MESIIVTIATWGGAFLIAAIGWMHAQHVSPEPAEREAQTWAYIADIRSRADAPAGTGR